LERRRESGSSVAGLWQGIEEGRVILGWRRAIWVLRHASPAPAAEGSELFDRLFLFEPVTLLTKPVDFGVHSGEEEFSRGRGDPRPLELEDFLPLAPDLDPHVLDLPSDEFEVCHFHPGTWKGLKNKKGT
jgi:hypothetical protein